VNPTISVIIPIYKVESYLSRCIDSIVNQTYTNLEIILVDDGSPDCCPSICDKYAANDDRIKVIHKENGGLSDARNAGLEIATGNYIAFVDSDDWIEPAYIERLLYSLQESDSDIAICEFEKTAYYKLMKPTKCDTQVYSSKQALIRLFQCKDISFATTWCKLYKVTLFKDIRFPIGKFHEDEFTTYLLYDKANTICYTPEKLYYYFQRNDSIMASKHTKDITEVLEQRYLFFKKKRDNELTSLLLPPLCWQLLNNYISCKKKKETIETNRHLREFKRYCSDMKRFNVKTIHKLPLHFFSKFPSTYFYYKLFKSLFIKTGL